MRDIRLADISVECCQDRSYVRIDGQRFHIVRDAAEYLRRHYDVSLEMASGILISKILDELLDGEEGAAP